MRISLDTRDGFVDGYAGLTPSQAVNAAHEEIQRLRKQMARLTIENEAMRAMIGGDLDFKHRSRPMRVLLFLARCLAPYEATLRRRRHADPTGGWSKWEPGR